MRIGILALQGAFAEHAATLDRLGAEHFEIRQLKDLDKPFDGLILPGGESTAMRKLLHDLGLFGPLLQLIREGLPVFGTCAGLILLAKTVDGGVPCFGTMNIAVKRNAYGRQLGSFYTEHELKGIGRVPMTFIRAPYIESVSGDAEILAQVDGRIVAAKQANQLVTAFHPELSDDLTVHRYFLNLIHT
ncbi:MAG: pyridoxal 5'-phosphate synthase glutaminase subunit PdxT [Oscillospiraceae bacterium]|nr:pyridoxal 5'-phosphate synthase glutaminase subunit PdxT [Oscillospiraceae bacterium]